MLLTLGDMDFLSKATEKGNDGLLVAKTFNASTAASRYGFSIS